MAFPYAFSIAVLFIVWILKIVISKILYNRKYKFPNVVPGWPLIGNTLDVPYPAGMHNKALAKKYGEM